MDSTRADGGARGRLQLQPGERRAQVVADGGQKDGPLVDMALDAAPHVEEGLTGLAHLAGAVRLEARVVALAKGVRGLRQSFDGAHLISDEQDRHAGEHQRRHRQPQDEDVPPRGEGPVPGAR